MPTPRHGHALVVVNGKILALGGFGIGQPLGVVEEYDPSTDRWSKKADMPTARGFFGAAALGGHVYAIAGRTREVPPIERYDPAVDRRERFDSMAERRNRFDCVVLGDCIYLIGGEEDWESHKDWRTDTTCYGPLVKP